MRKNKPLKKALKEGGNWSTIQPLEPKPSWTTKPGLIDKSVRTPPPPKCAICDKEIRDIRVCTICLKIMCSECAQQVKSIVQAEGGSVTHYMTYCSPAHKIKAIKRLKEQAKRDRIIDS